MNGRWEKWEERRPGDAGNRAREIHPRKAVEREEGAYSSSASGHLCPKCLLSRQILVRAN